MMPSPLAQSRSVHVLPDGERHPGTVWFDQHPGDLPVGEWSASDGKRLVAHSPSIDDLHDQLKRSQIPMTDVAVRYNSREATA